MQDEILEKTLRINQLFDFYSSLLTNKQQTFLRYYYFDNFSLGEIAGEFEISRQAVYEHIKRAEHMLEEYELKLKLLTKYLSRKQLQNNLRTMIVDVPEALKGHVHHILDQIEQLD